MHDQDRNRTLRSNPTFIRELRRLTSNNEHVRKLLHSRRGTPRILGTTIVTVSKGSTACFSADTRTRSSNSTASSSGTLGLHGGAEAQQARVQEFYSAAVEECDITHHGHAPRSTSWRQSERAQPTKWLRHS
jgi:hypothetical protein